MFKAGGAMPMIFFYFALTSTCLLGIITGIDMFLYKESMSAVLLRILIKSDSTGKEYTYAFFFIMLLLTIILDIQRYKKMKGKSG